MDITLRIAEEKDIPAIVALNKEQYGEDFFTNDEYFKWRFFNLKQHDSFLVCAFDVEKLVGATGISGSIYVYKKNTIKVGLVASSVIKKQYRLTLIRIGSTLSTIYGALLREAERLSIERNCALLIAFPNKNSLPHFLEQCSYSQDGYIDFLFYPLNFHQLLRNRGIAIPIILPWISKIAETVFRIFTSARIKLSSRFEFRQILDIHAVGSMWRTNMPGSVMAMKRDDDFFNWRFLNNSYLNYEILGAFENDKLCGYIVWKSGKSIDRTSNTHCVCTKLIDFYFDSSDNTAAIIHGLIGEMIYRARKQNSLFVYSTIKVQEDLLKELRKSGFFFLNSNLFGKKIPLVKKQLSALCEIPPMAEWYITMADNDIV